MAVVYRDKGNNILPELLTDKADEMAQQFLSEGKNSLTSAQLRRFYGEFKALEQKYMFRKEQKGMDAAQAFTGILPLVKMVKSKVAYAANPKNQKVPSSFKDWLTMHVDSINAPEDFEAFLLHFEAVVGFCYGRGMSNN
jgi:CRISPR-associated protein Csm2